MPRVGEGHRRLGHQAGAELEIGRLVGTLTGPLPQHDEAPHSALAAFYREHQLALRRRHTLLQRALGKIGDGDRVRQPFETGARVLVVQEPADVHPLLPQGGRMPRLPRDEGGPSQHPTAGEREHEQLRHVARLENEPGGRLRMYTPLDKTRFLFGIWLS